MSDRRLDESSAWAWQERDGIAWLTCALLADWPHAFGTRLSYPNRPDRLAPLQLGLAGERAFWTQQVHGNTIAWTNSPEFSDPAHRLEADATATTLVGQSVWATSADCVPILIAHAQAAIAIHSGWRGTAAQIASEAVAALQTRGIAPSELKIAIGPAISAPAYQVSQDVGDRVAQTLAESDTTPELPPVLHPDPQPDKVRLDLRSAIARQLVQAGVAIANISISPHCTFSQPEYFFSYRRDRKSPSPVQWSGIGLPEPTRVRF